MGAVRKPLPTESNTLLKPAEEYSHSDPSRRTSHRKNLSISEYALIVLTACVVFVLSVCSIQFYQAKIQLQQGIESYEADQSEYLRQKEILEDKMDFQYDYDRVIDAAEENGMSVSKERIRTIE